MHLLPVRRDPGTVDRVHRIHVHLAVAHTHHTRVGGVPRCDMRWLAVATLVATLLGAVHPVAATNFCDTHAVYPVRPGHPHRRRRRGETASRREAPRQPHADGWTDDAAVGVCERVRVHVHAGLSNHVEPQQVPRKGGSGCPGGLG